MRVAIACSGAGHIPRGVESWAKELAYGLHNTGQVDVTFFKGGGTSDSDFERIIPCLNRSSFLLTRRQTGIGYYIEQVTFVPNLIKELRREHYDIIHVPDPQVGLWLLRAKREGLIGSEIVFNHMMGGDRFSAQFETVDVLVPHFKERARLSGIDTSHWHVIPPAVDTERFRPQRDKSALRLALGIPNNAFVLLTVGSLENYEKRMKWVVKEVACARLMSKEKIFLLAAGAFCGEETEAILNYAKEVLVDGYKILVNVPHSQMPEIYAAADIFCLALLKPTFGISFVEAMASGLPVLFSDYPIPNWIIGDAGRALDMAKEGELARSTVEYLRNEDSRAISGRRGRERACGSFSKPVVIQKILAMYRDAINRGASNHP